MIYNCIYLTDSWKDKIYIFIPYPNNLCGIMIIVKSPRTLNYGNKLISPRSLREIIKKQKLYAKNTVTKIGLSEMVFDCCDHFTIVTRRDYDL